MSENNFSDYLQMKNLIMNNIGLVSIIIPCYNQSRFLGEAIESVQKQTHDRYEIIVVNDGSSDNTSEAAGKFPDVCLIEQKNAGLAEARNGGLKKSKGEFVIFLDADDRLLPNALEIGLKAFEKHPECAFVSGFCKFISSNGSPLDYLKQPRFDDKTDHYAALLENSYIWSPANVVYRRKVFEQTDGFNASVNAAADYELYLRIARQFPVYQHGEIVAEYRKHTANMSGNPELMLKNVLQVLDWQKEFVNMKANYEKARRRGIVYYSYLYGKHIAYQTFSYAIKLKLKKANQSTKKLLDSVKMSLNSYRR